MRLVDIKTEACPTCGAPPCAEGVEASTSWTEARPREIREHCHGGRWEWREFVCGLRIEYIPNFRREQPHKFKVCTNDSDRAAVHGAREAWMKRLMQSARRIGTVDDPFRNHVIERLRTDSFNFGPRAISHKEE